jgi:pyridoxine 5-phosphate synthase
MHSSETRLSVNLNKVALLRNSRGANKPNLLQVARDCLAFGAQGITVHPRPDGRHIRRQDVYDLAELLRPLGVEFNVEGYPTEDFLRLLEEVRPAQATLVPDEPGALTSDSGWDAASHHAFLTEVVDRLHAAGIRTSLFLNPEPAHVEAAALTGTQRIELYTGPYAHQFTNQPAQAVAPYTLAANHARQMGLGVNAGHDLDQHNLGYFLAHVPHVLEVSIGHAIICEALYDGLAHTLAAYRAAIRAAGR